MAGLSTKASLGLALGGAGVVRITDNPDTDASNNKIKAIQHNLVEQLDQLYMDSIKAQYDNITNYMDDAIGINKLRDSVKSNYNAVKEKIVDRINEIDWNEKKESMSSMYEKGKNKIKDFNILSKL